MSNDSDAPGHIGEVEKETKIPISPIPAFQVFSKKKKKLAVKQLELSLVC